MKKRAILIPFFAYPPKLGNHYKVFFDYFCKHTYEKIKTDTDTIYLIDGNYGFDAQVYPSKARVLSPAEDLSHWGSVKKALEEIPEEHILLLDQDVVITKQGIVDSWFEKSEEGFYVTAKDNSMGGRFAPYYTIFKKSISKEMHEINFTPDESHDSFGRFSKQIEAKLPDDQFYLIEDDRAGVYIRDGGISEEPKEHKSLGYYHIRNAGLGIRLLTTKGGTEYKQTIAITPPWEALRIMAWIEIISEERYTTDIMNIVKDIDPSISPLLWFDYINVCKEYHGL